MRTARSLIVSNNIRWGRGLPNPLDADLLKADPPMQNPRMQTLWMQTPLWTDKHL